MPATPRICTASLGLLASACVGLAWIAACGPAAIAQTLPGPRRMPSSVFEAPLTANASAPAYEDDVAPPPAAPLSLETHLDLATIDSLEQLALRHNPTLAQAARQIQSLQGEQLQAGLKPNPTFGYAAEEIGDDGGAGQNGIQVGQTFIRGGKLQLNRAVIGKEIAQARQRYEMQRRRVLNDVRIAAYRYLAAQRTVELAEQLVDIGKASVEAAEGLLKAREVSRVDVLQTRVAANTARLLLQTSENDAQAAWRRLAIVIGVPNMDSLRLADSLSQAPPELDYQQVLSALLAASPELAAAQLGVEQARCDLARQCAGRIPDISVNAAVRYNDESDTTNLSGSVTMPLQIYNRNQGNIMRAQADLAAARREVDRVSLDLEQRLANSFQQYANARRRVAGYEQDILPDAKSSLELVQQGYEGGEFGYLQLLTAQQTYFETNIAYVEALGQLWAGIAEIDGLLLRGGLQRPGE